jgi:hypothetical protein
MPKDPVARSSPVEMTKAIDEANRALAATHGKIFQKQNQQAAAMHDLGVMGAPNQVSEFTEPPQGDGPPGPQPRPPPEFPVTEWQPPQKSDEEGEGGGSGEGEGDGEGKGDDEGEGGGKGKGKGKGQGKGKDGDGEGDEDEDDGEEDQDDPGDGKGKGDGKGEDEEEDQKQGGGEGDEDEDEEKGGDSGDRETDAPEPKPVAGHQQTQGKPTADIADSGVGEGPSAAGKGGGIRATGDVPAGGVTSIESEVFIADDASLTPLMDVIAEIDAQLGGATDVVSTAAQLGIWLPAPRYWDAVREEMARILKDALGKLAPQEIPKQMGGFLSLPQALTWERGAMRIWKKRIPDLRLEAGLYVIISCDLSGSMQAMDMGAGDPAAVDFYPGGISPAMMGNARGYGRSGNLGSVLRGIGEVVEPTWRLPNGSRGLSDDSTIAQGFGTFYTVTNQRGGPEAAPMYMSRVHATAGMSYVVGQALADVGSEVELIWWGIGDRNWYNVVKDHQTVKDGKMYYPLEMSISGGTGPWEPAAFALKQFRASPAPGKMFVTITDGAWDYDNKKKYAEAVKEMNNNGVVTLFLVVGQEMSGVVKALKQKEQISGYRKADGSPEDIDDFVMGHHYSAAGSTVEALLQAVPQFIIDIQRDLVEKALRNTGIQ